MSGQRTVGPWLLLDRLGTGGNAEVWKARHQKSGAEVALKVLNVANASKEPYQRFVREIQTLRGLSDATGVLPLIDAHLPTRPNRQDRAWLAMPIATPIVEALRDKPLDVVVDAVRTIAKTLARLHDSGIGHRDVKPANLYALEGRSLVGDFGLVAIPDVEELTRSGKPLGPLHYTPYEMIVEPDSASPLPADVYSLAKTLWVLATAQRFPPDGHQPAGIRGMSIGEYRSDWKAKELDSLIDRSTVFNPEGRPTMEEFARDLESWAGLSQQPSYVDISEIVASFRASMRESLEQEDRAELDRERAMEAARVLTELVRPINQALQELHPRAEIDGSADEFTRNVLQTRIYLGTPFEIVWSYRRLSRISVGHRSMPFVLRFGRALELDSNGTLIAHMYIDVGYPALTGQSYRWMPEPWSAPVGSIEAERMLRTASQLAASELPEAARAFVAGIPEDRR